MKLFVYGRNVEVPNNIWAQLMAITTEIQIATDCLTYVLSPVDEAHAVTQASVEAYLKSQYELLSPLFRIERGIPYRDGRTYVLLVIRRPV